MKDRFSNHASGYATFRPTYPKELYEFLLKHVKRNHVAWDCGTGNGQVARDLAPYFKEVRATDISINQIKQAVPSANIYYSISPAEKTSFPDATFDLITVAQAIHWFNIQEFYSEVTRVARPDAFLAVWGYGVLRVSPPVDELIDDFYVNIIGPYWDAGRKLIDDHYKSVPFPFEEISAPSFGFSFEWTLAAFEGYLGTWSSVQKYIVANSANPVGALIEKIKLHWDAQKLSVKFPLFMRCGHIRNL